MLSEILTTFAGRFVAVCYAIFFISWTIGLFWTKRTAHRPGVWGRSSGIATVAGTALLIVLRRTGVLPLLDRRWSYSPPLGAVASILTAAGLLILLWGRVTLARNWSLDVVIRDDHQLIEHGPYRYVRHPIYTGTILMAAGAVLLLGTSVGLLMLIAFVIFLWAKLSREERLLMQYFPDAYPQYRRRVKALVPFVI
jgi:protein-S-isoprenylcysteine O-methyltransferase Ste14